MIIPNLLFHGHLDTDENITFVAHKHIFTAVKPITKTIFLGFLLPGLFLILTPFPPFSYVSYVWLGLGTIKLIYNLADWYFDAWLITSMSMIDVQWDGFFSRSSTRIEYHAIKGVSYKINGFFGTVFNYGDIYIEVYAANTMFVLQNAAFPRRIERAVLDAQAKFIEKKSFEDHETLEELLTTMIQTQKAYKRDK